MVIKKNKKKNKLHFQKFLKKKKIITRDFFYPLSEQPLLKKFNIKKTKLENSNFLFKNGLYIPCGLGNTFLEFNKVCNAILEYDKKFR